MKRNSIIRQAFIVMLVFITSAVFISRAAAAPENVDEKILHHFTKTFKSAQDVTWQQTKDYSKASFVRNNQHMEVFYDNKDELICTTTYINQLALPDATVATIADKYSDYNLTTAIKCVDAEGNTRYYTELENDKKRIILESDTDGSTTVFKTTRIK